MIASLLATVAARGSQQSGMNGKRVTTYEAMRQAVCQYAARAVEMLRGERQLYWHIAVFVKTSPFAVNIPYYGNVASEKLRTPSIGYL